MLIIVTDVALLSLNQENSLALAAAGGAVAAGGNSSRALDAGAAVAVAGLISAIAHESGNEEVPVISYTIELQGGGIVEMHQADQIAIPINSKVLVTQYSSGQQRVRIDNSQGREYNRTQSTNYAD